MGRNTYEIMASYWPTSDHPSAKAMNEIPKVVFSRTLKTAADWPETRIACGDTAEYRLWVLPAITGKGAPLVPPLDEALKLRLVKSTVFPLGVLELVYVPAEK
jgi:hypothetical protein